MPTRRSLTVARLSVRLLASDPAPMIATLVMPIIMSVFLSATPSGASQTVPGMAILFAFLTTQLVAMLFYREHAWGTWDRLRVSQASTFDIVVGKVVPLYALQLAQSGVVFAFGTVLLGYRITGTIGALVVVLIVFTFALTSFGVMLVSLFRTMDAVMVLGSLGGMILAGLGGALAPTASMPAWVQPLAYASPAYWALEALRSITLDGAGVPDVATQVLVLAGFGVGFATVAALRFRPSETKIGTT